jgi:hypothetical protein
MGINRITWASVLTLVAAYLGLFDGLVDSNAVNLARPAVRADLGGGLSGAQWIADAYNVTFAAVLLTAGSLGDRFGRRRLLRLGPGDLCGDVAGLRTGAVTGGVAGRTCRPGPGRGRDVAAGVGHRGCRVSRRRRPGARDSGLGLSLRRPAPRWAHCWAVY